MRKIFLASSFGDVYPLIPTLLTESMRGKKVSFIPTASIHEKVDFFVAVGKEALEELGCVVDVLEVSTASKDETFEKIKRNDYVYVTGGNTFFLLQELKKSGADRLIAEHIRSGKLYMGESAGAIVLSSDIRYVETMDDASKVISLEDFQGLELIDIFPLPHYKSYPFEEIVESIICEQRNTKKLYPFTNEEAIWIEGDTITKLIKRGNSDE